MIALRFVSSNRVRAVDIQFFTIGVGTLFVYSNIQFMFFYIGALLKINDSILREVGKHDCWDCPNTSKGTRTSITTMLTRFINALGNTGTVATSIEPYGDSCIAVIGDIMKTLW